MDKEKWSGSKCSSFPLLGDVLIIGNVIHRYRDLSKQARTEIVNWPPERNLRNNVWELNTICPENVTTGNNIVWFKYIIFKLVYLTFITQIKLIRSWFITKFSIHVLVCYLFIFSFSCLRTIFFQFYLLLQKFFQDFPNLSLQKNNVPSLKWKLALPPFLRKKAILFVIKIFLFTLKIHTKCCRRSIVKMICNY